ncbi:MAG TPA: imidazole glycerol phosphate synthase subunit HisH [Spirochaetales bacterium]|nr:imidazole glycerol phosphate synthase subunit HisH [Spirochaetales bacterium]
MLVIINYNLGNLKSIQNMIRKIGFESKITNNIEEIRGATKLILPGVGAFDNGMHNLKELGLISVLEKEILENKKPILGICLGMQLLTKKSEEGTLSGLGFIDAETKLFKLENTYKIPHMGWNTAKPIKKSKLFSEMENQENRFYFVHSYYVDCSNTDDILTVTKYGTEFVSMFEHENIIGAQFHPEKSHKFGMQLLKNFLENY